MSAARQLRRFVVVGVAATATHVAVALLCIELLGLGVQPGTFVAFTCALILSYLLNRAWTYQAGGRHRRQLPRFVLVSLAGYGLNAAIMALATELLGRHYLVGVAVVVMVLPMLTFLSHRYWTFSDEKKAENLAA
jgi:putative flippase GtrA